ncbi:MAG TPA: 30S ribosome-binding factor RbfA [Tepidisphaeraceae bacterium]
MNHRTEKIASMMQQEIAEIIQRELSDPRLPTITSVTRVKVSSDLSTADVFVSMMGTPGQQAAGLNALRHSAGLIRTILTKNMSLRQAPFLKFHIDEALQKELALMDLLRKVEEEQKQKTGDTPQ